MAQIQNRDHFRSLFVRIVIIVAFSVTSSVADVIVNTPVELKTAIENANSGGDNTILLTDNTYTLPPDYYLKITADHITIRGQSGNRDAVIIEGQGMGQNPESIFKVRASYFTCQDMTLRKTGNHVIQIHGELNADYPTLKNLVIQDGYEQLVKISGSSDTINYCDGGVMENCLLEYTMGIGPQYYIGGIDAHRSRDWVVSSNIFKNIVSPSGSCAEHAVHFWSWSEDTLVENNLIINCDRGIGFGLSGSGHINGIIRNNIIFHDGNSGDFADVSIEVFNCDNAKVYNNTIYQNHDLYYAAIKNYGSADATIQNNLIHMSDGFYGNITYAVWVTGGGTGTVSDNVINTPESSWFVSLTIPDTAQYITDVTQFLHVADFAKPFVMDQGTSDISDLPSPFIDFDGDTRPQGAGIDIGADEIKQQKKTALPYLWLLFE